MEKNNQNKVDVLVVLGSASDIKKIAKVFETLRNFGLSYMGSIASAHRTPEKLERTISKTVQENGVKVIISAAGMSNALSGSIAAKTVRPVIGVPISSDKDFMTDTAVKSTLGMPPGIPVATVGPDAAENAAILAIEMLAISNPELEAKLIKYREQQVENVNLADEKLQKFIDLLGVMSLEEIFSKLNLK